MMNFASLFMEFGDGKSIYELLNHGRSSLVKTQSLSQIILPGRRKGKKHRLT